MPYVSRRSPRAKQAEAAELIRGKKVFAVLAAMRVGKSKIITDDWGALAYSGDCPDLLMIAPSGVYKTWPDAVLSDIPEDLAAITKIFLWDSDRARTKSARLEREDFMQWRKPRVLVVNVEALSTVEAARELCLEFLRQRPGKSMCVIDESVKIKEESSRCGRFCAEVLAPLAARRRIMTGLVSPRSPLDLYNQFRFLDWRILGHAQYSTFKARYAREKRVCVLPANKLYGMLKTRLGLGSYLTRPELQVRAAVLAPGVSVKDLTDRALREFVETQADCCPRDAAVAAISALGGYVQTIPIIEGYENVEELAEKIAPYSFRCRLEDCYDLPPSDYSFWDVGMHPEQRRVYEEVRLNATAELESMDHVTATHVVVRMLRLHQILCGHAVDETRVIHDVPELRTAALVELLEDYDGKAVVWCSYDYSVRRVADALAAAFGAGSVARFWGGNVKTREAEELVFQTRPECRFMVGTPDAGGKGRDWSVADLCVYYSCRNNLDHRMQSEDRLKAVGKTRSIAYVDMRARETVEEKIVRCLRDKLDMAAVISGDDWRSWLI